MSFVWDWIDDYLVVLTFFFGKSSIWNRMFLPRSWIKTGFGSQSSCWRCSWFCCNVCGHNMNTVWHFNVENTHVCACTAASGAISLNFTHSHTKHYTSLCRFHCVSRYSKQKHIDIFVYMVSVHLSAISSGIDEQLSNPVKNVRNESCAVNCESLSIENRNTPEICQTKEKLVPTKNSPYHTRTNYVLKSNRTIQSSHISTYQ